MYRIGVIGDADSILGFKATGMTVFPVRTPDEAAETLHRLASDQYAIVYITENYASRIAEAIDTYKDSKLPAVIPIPSIGGTEGLGIRNIRKWIERAVGADTITK
jgi:V/A-type H+-transporting ATPase subunit F